MPKHFDLYDAVVDSTVAVRYQELDQRYPGSKFILTVRRDVEAWLESYHRHIGTGDVSPYAKEWQEEILYYRPLLFGTVQFEEATCRAAYFRHVDNIRHYFQGREHDLLEMDIPSGDRWGKLCAFLDQPIPEEPFPHLNQGDLSRRLFQSRATKYDIVTGNRIDFP